MHIIEKTYKDFNGNERTEKFHFHFTKAEALDMELSVNGGLSEKIKRLQSEQNQPEIIKLFREIVKAAYGVKSADGRSFYKGEQELREFTSTQAYADIYFELALDDEKAAEFLKNVMPEGLDKELDAIAAKQQQNKTE